MTPQTTSPATAAPRVYVNPGDTSFTVYCPKSRSFVLSAFNTARYQRRGDFYAMIDLTTDRTARRWIDERVARRILKVSQLADLVTLRACNVMLVTDDGIEPMSDAAPISSPYCTADFLRSRGLLPPAEPKSESTEPSNEGGDDDEEPAAPPARDVPASAQRPARPAADDEFEERRAAQPNLRSFYAWRDQSYKLIPVNEVIVGDRIKIREPDGTYVRDEQNNVEFVVTGAPKMVDGQWQVETEAYVAPERQRRTPGPTSVPPIPVARRPERASRSRARA